MKEDFKKLSILISTSVTGWFSDLYLTVILFLSDIAILPASKITFFETSSRKEGKKGSDNYFPPRVKFSTRHEGAFIPKLNSRSFAGIKDINISTRLPAIVISETG